MRILHIATRVNWEAAQAGGLYSCASLASEGFIHCAKPDQLMHVLTRYFPSALDHAILEIDTELVKAEIRWEGAAETFPHIYGELNLDAVTRWKALWQAG